MLLSSSSGDTMMQDAFGGMGMGVRHISPTFGSSDKLKRGSWQGPRAGAPQPLAQRHSYTQCDGMQ